LFGERLPLFEGNILKIKYTIFTEMSYYSDYTPLEKTQQFNGRVNISKPSALEIPSFYKQQQQMDKQYLLCGSGTRAFYTE